MKVVTSAPGRVNLIGEHTDYNGGFVLPTPIAQRTYVELDPRDDDLVMVRSRELGSSQAYRLGDEHRRGVWLDYVQGCTAELRREGHQLTGMELSVRSDVPLGSGLGSSAALEVALLRAIRIAFQLDLDDVALALVGQRAETELVGAPVGAMDQLVASLGEPGKALFLDMRTLAAKSLPLPAADLIVIESGVQHDHATGDYRTRRVECEEAALLLDIESLRDLSPPDLPRLERLPPILARRAHHVITENARVLAMITAFERGDLDLAGRLFRESHASQRDDFEVSVPAIDTLVELAAEDADVYGARLTGGGFGGSIVALARPGSGARAAESILRRYRAWSGNAGRILLGGPPPSAR